MINNEIEKLARDTYVTALATASNLDTLSKEDRMSLFQDVADVTIDFAQAFYVQLELRKKEYENEKELLQE